LGDEIVKGHTVILDSRKAIEMSGVKEVLSFDDETILVDTVMGKITVKGEELHIKNFSNEIGDLGAVGKIHGVIYHNSGENRGFISRLLK